MRERDIELYLKHQCVIHDALCWKWVSPGVAGVPDRVVAWPGGRVIFVELKAPGQKPRMQQQRRIEQLRARGAEVAILDSLIGVDAFIKGLKCGV